MATLNRQSAGFTLVEVLIAIVIMSSVVVLAGQSYRQFVVTANDFDKKYGVHLQQLQKEQVIREKLESSRLYMANKQHMFTQKDQYPYWIGNESSWAGITTQSLQDENRSAVFLVSIQDNNLTYCEKVIDEWLPTTGVVPEGVCQFSIVLDENVTELNFKYFGWDSYDSLITIRQAGFLDMDVSHIKPSWFSSYLGEKRRVMPMWVDMRWKHSNETETSWLIPVKYQDPTHMYSAYKQQSEGGN